MISSATVGGDAELLLHKTADGCTYYVVKNTAFSPQTEAIRARRWCTEGVYKVGSRMHACLFCYDVFFARVQGVELSWLFTSWRDFFASPFFFSIAPNDMCSPFHVARQY